MPRRVQGLLDRQFELAFELAAEGAGFLRHDNRVLAGLNVWFSPREPAATASAILQIGRRDFFSVGGRGSSCAA